MKAIINKILSVRALVALMLACAASGAWADFAKTNPVTGETENYTWKFIGTTDNVWNNTDNWQDSNGAHPSAVPEKANSDVWDPILFDGNAININAGMRVEGWGLRMGLYNGARITLNNLRKLQNSGSAMWITVDSSSKFAIGSTGFKESDSEARGGAIGESGVNINFYVASENGIDFQDSFDTISDQGATVNYYLTGAGSVKYATISAANHKIKQADVTLSNVAASKRVCSRTLVSFTSSTKTFTAEATIKVKNADGTANRDVALSSVTATTSTLTASGNVGDCELVQTSTGILLYYVDYAKTYKPSININFTSGTALSTSGDVGLDDYAIPGTSWNNLAGSNGSLSALKAADPSGATFATAASVAITEARGSYSCSSLTPASDLRHGYIDESTSGLTPTITVSGIPYEKYRVIVYTATDAESKTFGYLTINGKNYTYVNSALTEGTSAWGASGGQNTAEPMAEGVNVLVSPVTLGSTLTVVGHRNGDNTRGCIAAVQIVEYVPEVTENDLVIPVVGASATYPVSEAKELSGTVYLVGNGTLTLDGSAKITAATIDVAKDVVLNINADRLDATIFTGLGTVVYEGKKPASGKGWTDNSGWKGTVWVKNIPASSDERKDWNPALYGNADSTLRFTNVNLYFPNNTTTAFPGTIDLDGAGMNICDGYGGSIATIARLTGSGTLSTTGGSSNGNGLTINNASEFAGTITLTKYKVIVGSATGTSASGVLQIESGKVATIASGMTWTAPGGFVVNGTLNANGTLVSSASSAVSGSGTVVFTGRAPTVSGDAWWKNSNWTGTVQVKDITNMVGDNRTGTWLQFNEYGNSGSVVEMNNVTGWLPTNFTCIPKLKVTGSVYLNNGGSGKASAFKVGTLLGSGTISGDGSAVTVVFNVTTDWSDFTGTIGLNNKCIVFGEAIPDTLTAGTIYISEGAVVTPQQSSGTWWAVGGIKVDGELRAPNLGKFGGGTTITTSDNGVFTLLTASQIDDQSTSYARITGTGTLRYADGGGNNWRTLSQTDFPTGMICENNISAGLILKTAGGNHTIGSLAGSGKVRSDWGSGNRNLRILQAKDTTYSGLFDTDDRVGTVTVAPGTSTAGTLTLSGKQTASNDLTVESGAKVNLTGTWKGATSVSGSLAFGDAGKIDGAVTTVAGSTLDYTTATGTDHITGALTLTKTTTVKLPKNAKFPYKLAGSISDVTSPQYTIGDAAGTYPLSVNTTTGEIDIKASASISESGETISWSDLSWTASESDGLTIVANESRTLALGSATAGKITFNVAANKTLTLTGTIEADEICITGTGTVLCSATDTLTGIVTGSGTVEYPEHVLPTMADWTSEDWEGTLILKNCGREQNANYYGGETHEVVRFDEYGSAYSVIRAPGYKGISAVTDQNTTCPATLFIDAGETVEFNHGTGESELDTNGAGFRFAKLAGTGTLRLDGTSDTAQYIFNDVTEFAGTVEITFPEEGGRKSFLFGAEDNWEVMNSAYAANLVILDDMTVAAGKTWDIPAGIIIGSGKTLTLGNGATVKALSKDTEGTIAVPSGTATLQGISNAVVNANITIGSGATLNITDPSLTTLTIPADSTAGGTYSNAHMLNLSGCTSLTTLHLALGEAKTFDLTKVTLPSTCTKVYYDIGSKRDLDGYASLPESSETVEYAYYATETIEEYANSDSAGFTATNVPDGADVYLLRQNGMTLKADVSGTSRTYTGGRSFAGGACWHEWDFEQSNIAERLNDTGRFFVNPQAGAVTLSTVSSPTESDYTTVRIDVQNEDKRVLSSFVNPNAAIAFGTTWSAALRCSLPTLTRDDGKVVAIAFGDTTSGVLGLAAGADGFMELFTWASGVYTVLAQLQVESPSDKDNMHIYVFTVNNGTVSFYRDGEFIHTAAFTLPGSITKFMVGDVVNRGEAQNLPSAVASGGYIDYIRLYDSVLPVADVQGLSVRRPFVSAIDTYERTVGLFQNWSATDAWTCKKGNNGGTATADAPADSANVTLIVDGETDMSLNLASDAAYNTLIFDGNGVVGLYQASTGMIGADMMVVRNGVDLTVDYDAVSLANAVVGVDAGASLTFDFSYYPFDAVTAVTTITLAGNVPAVLYDNTSQGRFSVLLPNSLPVHISSAEASWDGTSYKVTITPDHTAGGSVYYKDGALAAGMTVYTDAELTAETKLFAGDTLVISSASSTGDVSVDDTFNANISVTRSTVSLTSTGTAALAGKTITAAESCAVSLSGDGFGALTLVGPGSFSVAGDTTVARLTGTVGITVEAGKTLTLGSVSSFLDGGAGGTGTVKLPAISGGNGFDFRPYGDGNGTIALTSFSEYLKATGSEAVNVGTALRLDGNMTITALSNWDYTFAKICGTGNFTVPNSGTPKSFTISKLEDYSGTLVNNHARVGVTVAKLITNGAYGPGDVLLTKDGSGTVTISSVEVGGVTKQGVWDGNNFCLAAAEYNGTKYKTVAAAIAVAGDANLSAITIYENTETLEAKYMFVTEDNSIKVALKPFAVVNGATTTYHETAQDAIIKVAMTPWQVYDYIEVIVGGSVDIPLSIFEELKIKKTGGATLNFTGIADDCTTSEKDLENGVVKYTKSNKATVYTWTGAAFDSNTGDPDPRWAAKGNWSYVNSSSATVPASRQPQAGDTVAFSAAATVTLGGNVTVDSVTCGAPVTFGVDGSTTLTATTGIVLTDAAASITVSGVTLSPTPTSGVADTHVVTTTSAGTTTYELEYDFNAVGSITDGKATITDGTKKVTVPKEATSIETVPVASIKLEDGSTVGTGDITVKYGEITTTGAYTITKDGNVISFAINTTENAAVTVGEESIKVKPEIRTGADTEPMTLDGDTPGFTVKTIPGLYYSAESCSTPNGTFTSASVPRQATTASTVIETDDDMDGVTVKYYRIKVGTTPND